VWFAGAARDALCGPEATTLFLGVDKEGRPYFAADLTRDPAGSMIADMGAFEDMRAAAARLPDAETAILGCAKTLIEWHARHGFCANCGAPTTQADAGYKRYCQACNTEHFPRTDPVVIMLALNGDSCLLGRQEKWPPGFYSALAGFVEPGETIEEAVARELTEEAGIKIGDVLFHSTQPWPYPSSLMIGCFARATTTDVTVDMTELSDARWFTRAEVKDALEKRGKGDLRLPPPLAIAHQLVKSWVEEA
jgi:NAD+ diphosphatase